MIYKEQEERRKKLNGYVFPSAKWATGVVASADNSVGSTMSLSPSKALSIRKILALVHEL
jgi:hypothetical protein